MSSPRTAAKDRLRRKSVRPAGKVAAKVVGKIAAATPSADAARLAAEMERHLAGGRPDALTPKALQDLMAVVCKTYAAQIEAGGSFVPLGPGSGVTDTAIMITTSGLLRAANLQVFELGMWQSWTGR